MESITDTGRSEFAHQDTILPKPFVSILDGSTIGRARGGKPSRRTLAKKAQRQVHLFKSNFTKSLARKPQRSYEGKSPSQRNGKPGPKTQILDAVVSIAPTEKTLPSIDSPHKSNTIIRRLKIPVRLKAVPRIPYFAVILVAVVFFGFAGTKMFTGASNFPVSSEKLILPDEDSVQAALLAYLEPDDGADAEAAVGNLPPVPVSLKMSTYTVRTGDTIDRIAKRFGLRQDTLVSMNNLQGPQSVKPGIQLRIPNMDGISHKVRKGDSLLSIAKTYGADITRLVDANNLEDGTITVGQSLFIPNARLASATMQNFYSVNFVWPVRGPISSPFGYRSNPFTGLRTYHSALDIAIPLGTKVKATRAGTVADTGYNSVFGNYIILKHSNGYQSLYGHLSTIGVREGQSVDQGAVIGNSGNTGESTGPHLHFSIFQNGKALDPRKFLK